MITLKVRDVMTTTVVTVTPETPLKDVAHLMIDHAVSGIPVVDRAGAVIGVVSEADLLVKERGAEGIHRRPLAGLFGDSKATRAQRDKVSAGLASQAMTSPAITIAPERPLRDAADLMIERKVNRLPVVGPDGELLGIVTRADVVRAFTRIGPGARADRPRRDPPTGPVDRAVRAPRPCHRRDREHHRDGRPAIDRRGARVAHRPGRRRRRRGRRSGLAARRQPARGRAPRDGLPDQSLSRTARRRVTPGTAATDRLPFRLPLSGGRTEVAR